MKKFALIALATVAAFNVAGCATLSTEGKVFVTAKAIDGRPYGWMPIADAIAIEDAMNADTGAGERFRTAYEHFPVQDSSGRPL